MYYIDVSMYYTLLFFLLFLWLHIRISKILHTLIIFTLIKVNVWKILGEICNNQVNPKNLKFDKTQLSWGTATSGGSSLVHCTASKAATGFPTSSSASLVVRSRGRRSPPSLLVCHLSGHAFPQHRSVLQSFGQRHHYFSRRPGHHPLGHHYDSVLGFLFDSDVLRCIICYNDLLQNAALQ